MEIWGMFGSTTQKQNTRFKQHNTHFHLTRISKKLKQHYSNRVAKQAVDYLVREKTEEKKKKTKNPYIEETKFWIKE